MSAPLTFERRLIERARETPERVAYSFRSGPPEAPRLTHLTYGELLAAASEAAHRMLDAGLAGRPVLLAFAPGLDFVTALFGALLAGATAVPIYPPATPDAVPQALAIGAAAGATHALSSPELAKVLAHMPGLDALVWSSVDHRRRSDHPPRTSLASTSGDPPRLLQFTSGTTRAPRPIPMYDRHLFANSEVIRVRFGHDASSRGVIWLPPYHDMGLIGGILQPMHVGFPVVLLSPLEMLARPERWLAAISDHRATTSGGPDFAYALAARKVPESIRAHLDLSSWRVAFSGAERVRRRTLDQFATTFAPCGFDRRAFHPCYGLAEATLYTTGAQGITHHPDHPELVSSGVPADGHEVRVVDPESRLPCASDAIGAIEVRGPSVCVPGADGWLATGDLGRVRDGHLYVVGRDAARLKIRGRLVHAEDIEDRAATIDDALRAGRAAAFTLDRDDRDVLVLVMETRAPRDPEAVRSAIDRALAPLGVSLDRLVLVAPGTIPRTSSGKVRRDACRALYRDLT